MGSRWIAEASRLAAFLSVALIIGVLLGRPLLLLTAALAVYLVLHLRSLYRLDRWLHLSARSDPPEADGIWGEVLHQLYRLRRRNRQRKERIARLVKEYRISAAALPDGVLLLNADKEINWTNPAARDLLGIDAARDVGQRVTNLIRDPEFLSYLNDSEASQDPVEIEGEDGHHVNLQLVPYGDGQTLLLVRDVTRLHQLERMRTDFVANASHELRSPITVIAGYLETMRDDPAMDSQWREPLEEMERQADRMQDLVTDLLDLSRLESTERRRIRVPIDVHSLLATVVEDARKLAKPGQEIELALETDLQIDGSELELHSAFSNLVANACKYTPEGGLIRVRWSSEGEGARLAVTDSGPGIAPEHLPRLTERFYRVDRGRARDQGGSGLGLAIVKYALQRHQARLVVESDLGAGSCFCCHFPAEIVLPGGRA